MLPDRTVCFGAPRAITSRNNPCEPSDSAARGGQVPSRSAAFGAVWTLGRAGATSPRVEPAPDRVADRPVGRSVANRQCPRGHPPDVVSAMSFGPTGGGGTLPIAYSHPPRCPWWPNRTPRTRLARPTRPACSRWWRFEPRSRARASILRRACWRPRTSSLTPPSPAQFSSDFEGGNLGSSKMLSECEYELTVRHDTCAPRHRLWFHFSASNHRPTRRCSSTSSTFPNQSLYKDGMSPTVRTASQLEWARLHPKNVFYYKSTASRKGLGARVRGIRRD